MKQLLFLLLFPCFALAQYQGNANQKITLGEQTTADGLVYRGRLADTANLLTNKLDTSVYIVLDTGTRAMWYYSASTTPKWTRLVDSLNNLQGTLSVAKGGTGITSLGTGVATFLGTPTSDNLAAAVTNETGSGALVFATQPIFTNTIGVGGATASTSGGGITFPATQASSTNANTLDDYEEGAWTPAYEGISGSAGSLAYASGYPRGRYTKIGRLVVATGEIELTNKGSWTSGVRITGLPFNISESEIAQGFCVASFVDFAAGELYLNTRNTGAASPMFYFDKTKDNASREILFTTAVSNNSIFYFSLTYQIF